MIQQLAAKWRDEAELFRRRGLIEAADLAESYAAELETEYRAHQITELSLTDAAEESGLAYDTLQKKVSRGEIPNVGRRGAPRVRRCDLLADEVLLARLAG